MGTPGSADALVARLRQTLAARADEPSEVLVHERSVPAQPPTLGVLRPRLPPPLARALVHPSLLPETRRWRELLGDLGVVVVDELHSYRGVFGAHVALVVRRLRRLSAAYGAQPAFVGASATIANPVELAEHVVGLPST